jgi:hypothetical protein
MAAQERNVEIISNNIENMRTTGYKRQRAEFQDLLYQQLRRAGAQTSDTGTLAPTGIEIGSGVKTAATPRIMSQGTVTGTEAELDLAVSGEGFFAVQLPDGRPLARRDREQRGVFALDEALVDLGCTRQLGRGHEAIGREPLHREGSDRGDGGEAQEAVPHGARLLLLLLGGAHRA